MKNQTTWNKFRLPFENVLSIWRRNVKLVKQTYISVEETRIFSNKYIQKMAPLNLPDEPNVT